MAILINCYSCGKEFGTSACDGSMFCDDCNGVNEEKCKEKERWNNLSQHDKIEELLRRIEYLENQNYNNGLIG